MDNFLRQHIENSISLTDEEFDFIKKFFVPKSLTKHQFLLQEGDKVKYDYLVVKGLLKSYINTIDGKQHILQFSAENYWITDFQAYLNQTPAKLNIDCLEDSVVLGISLENFDKICKEIPKLEHLFRKKSNRAYMNLQQRILCLLSDDAKTKYENFAKQYPNLLQRIPKKFIAQFLGVSRETLSRLYQNPKKVM